MEVKNFKPEKRIRRNILDLKINYPEEFGRFIMALDVMIKSDDWNKICGVHGLSFNPFDKEILCPTNPIIVSQITGIGEPQYCPHGVRHFLIWHTVYLLEFEYLLNKYNQSEISNDFISLPWLNIASIVDDLNGDYDFMSDKNITIQFDMKTITIPNPLIGGNIYLNFREQKTRRNGYLKTRTKTQQNLMNITQKQFDDSLLISNYESLSSSEIIRTRRTIMNTISSETPHNTLHTTVGGSGGSMSSISTASHDPIFWLHHCNIDRYFYNWMLRVTNNFTVKLTQQEILPETLDLILAPFFPNQINLIATDDFVNYKFCYLNDTKTFIKIEDVIDLSQFNYTYEIITLKQKLEWKPYYFELIGIHIPNESCIIKLYIVPKNIDFENIDENDKEEYIAGSGCWLGINREAIHCERCMKTRTNVTIDISHYIMNKSINKKNISKYNLIFIGYGLGIVNQDGSFNTYSQEQILSSGTYSLILDADDILSAREFKFDKKYLHTRLIKSIIYKLNKLGYIIENVNSWDEIIKMINKFELDWGMNFKDLIKMKLTDKLFKNSTSDDTYSINKINLLSDLFKKNRGYDILNKIYYSVNDFNENYLNKINNCINEWINLFHTQNIYIKFILIDKNNYDDDINIIEFNYIPIDGEYGTCGDTELIAHNMIRINIDSEENYKDMNGLFELVINHELGHAFGLSHNSDPESIMYPFISNLDKKVKLNDILNIFNN